MQAAAELFVTHGAVSRQVRQLEDELGLSLFERRNRAVFLTSDGQRLFAVCHSIMQQIHEVVAALAAPRAPGPIVVSCEPTIAMRWLIPRLPRLRECHPDIVVHLLAAGGPVDFVRDQVDLALRRNDFDWPASYHAEPIAAEWMGPVCTPDLASNLTPTLASTPDLSSITELHSQTRPLAWQQWRRQSQSDIAFGAAQYFEHFYLSLQAAQAGLGMAIGSIYMVADELEAGRLHAPWGFVADQSEYVLLSPVALAEDDRRRRFAAWLRDDMQRSLLAIQQRIPTLARLDD